VSSKSSAKELRAALVAVQCTLQIHQFSHTHRCYICLSGLVSGVTAHWTASLKTEQVRLTDRLAVLKSRLQSHNFAKLRHAYNGLELGHLKIEFSFESMHCLFQHQVHQLSAYLAKVAFLCDQIGPGRQIKHFRRRCF